MKDKLTNLIPKKARNFAIGLTAVSALNTNAQTPIESGPPPIFNPKYKISAVTADFYSLDYSYKVGAGSILTWRDAIMTGATVDITKQSDNENTKGLKVSAAKSLSAYSTDDDEKMHLVTERDFGVISFHNSKVFVAAADLYKKQTKKTKGLKVSYKRFDNIDAKTMKMIDGVETHPVYANDSDSIIKKHQLVHLAHIKPYIGNDFNLLKTNKSKIDLSVSGTASVYFQFDNWRGRNMKTTLVGLNLGTSAEINYIYKINRKLNLRAGAFVSTDQGFYSGIGVGKDHKGNFVQSHRRTDSTEFGLRIGLGFGKD